MLEVTEAKLYVTVVTLSAEEHAKLVKQFNEGFKRLFVLAYDNTAGDDQVSVNAFKKYFLLREFPS